MKKMHLLLFILPAILWGQWSNDPAQNNAICDLNGEQAIPKIVNGPSGDTYIGWFSNDSGNYDVRMQRLDDQGNELWNDNGILISDNPAMTWLTDWDMTVDDENHAIITFQDIRNGGNNNVYAYRISPDGAFIWGDDGLELSNSTAFSAAPKVAVTSAGNAVIAWSEEANSIMQKITPDGTLLWGDSGITLSSTNDITWPQPFAVDNDAILLKYFEDSGPPYAPTRHCYIQKYDIDGNAVWTDPTAVSNAGGISAWTQDFNIISDENNGCFITWHDSRGGGTISYPFVQHILSDGSIGLPTNGLQLCSAVNRQNFYPESVYFDVEDILITYWFQTDVDQNNFGIAGQKVDLSIGNLMWGANASNLINISPDYYQLAGVRKAENDLMLFLEEYTNGIDSYLTATKLDINGNYVWMDERITMCSIASEKVHTVVSQLCGTQLIAAWEDDRNGNKDIYAQNINLDGSLGGNNQNTTVKALLVDYNSGDLFRIDLAEPTNEILLGNIMPFMGDIEFHGNGNLYGLPLQGTEFMQINTTTAAYTQIGNSIYQTGHFWTGLAFDASTNNLYAVSTDGSFESAFYTIEISNGDATLISINQSLDSVTDIAFDENGQMYAFNLQDEIFLIDKTTGEATFLGNTGYQAVGPWHGMDYNQDNNTMYLATYDAINLETSLKTVDLATGSTTYVGPFNHLTSGFAISYEGILEGNVVLNGGIGNIEEVEITVGTSIYNPDPSGYFSISLQPGAYFLEASLQYYTPVIISNIVIAPGNVTTIPYDIILDWIIVLNPPQNISVDPTTGEITWDPPEPYPGIELLGYNLYLDGVQIDLLNQTNYTLQNLVNGQIYTVGLSAVYEQGESDIVTTEFVYSGTGIEDYIVSIRESLHNYPNPFNPTTTISFNLTAKDTRLQQSYAGQAQDAKVEIFNLKGQKVRSLKYSDLVGIKATESLYHSVIWNGTDENDKPVPSGVYLYQLKMGNLRITKKMLLMK